MSQLLEKSTQSLAVAKEIANKYYSSCVNRSYYACAQFLMHTLFSKKIVADQSSFDSQARLSNKGTHEYAAYLIELELAQKAEFKDFKWFQSHIKEFRKLRKRADYTGEILSQTIAVNSITEAESLMNIVRKSIK